MEDAMNFGQALEALKDGKRVARDGWNGKDMWLALVQPTNVPGPTRANYMSTPNWGLMYPIEVNGESPNIISRPLWPRGGPYQLLAWIGMKTADSCFVPWLASQTDLLAEDWGVARPDGA